MLQQSSVNKIFLHITMTIHPGWVEVMKRRVPHAFTKNLPFSPTVAYIDGMPLMMAGKHITKWDDLIRYNFCFPVKRFFKLGCETVVLAFDDYKYVPPSKSITQCNRAKNKAPFEFNDRQHLETVMPSNYNDRLANRVYKRKVIDLIAETIVDHLQLAAGQKLIIDYTECPVVFYIDICSKKVAHKFITNVPPCGECDIKFTRWGRMFGDIIAHSVDGDFIPIALMEYEKQVQLAHTKFNICIYRLEHTIPEEKGVKKGVKRPHEDSILNYLIPSMSVDKRKNNSTVDTGGGNIQKPLQKKKRTMEYVNIKVLYASMKEVLEGTNHGQPGLQHMRILACMIGLTGTDFTRGIPLLGPKTVWEFLVGKNPASNVALWGAAAQCYDQCTGQFVPEKTCDDLVSQLYFNKFPKHTRAGQDMAETMRLLHRSSLAERSKSQLPSIERVLVTVRNINWLIQYWECRQPSLASPALPTNDDPVGDSEIWLYSSAYPDPVCEEFGFARLGKGIVQWWDVATNLQSSSGQGEKKGVLLKTESSSPGEDCEEEDLL